MDESDVIYKDDAYSSEFRLLGDTEAVWGVDEHDAAGSINAAVLRVQGREAPSRGGRPRSWAVRLQDGTTGVLELVRRSRKRL